MCGLILLDPETGEIVESENISNKERGLVGVGKLLLPEKDAAIEVARLLDDGYTMEVISERAVLVSLEGLRIALQELGFSVLENIVAKIFSCMRDVLGTNDEKEKST